MDAQDRVHLAVALVVVLLIGAGYWLLTELRRNGQLEECLMQRRRNCEQLLRR